MLTLELRNELRFQIRTEIITEVSVNIIPFNILQIINTVEKTNQLGRLRKPRSLCHGNYSTDRKRLSISHLPVQLLEKKLDPLSNLLGGRRR